MPNRGGNMKKTEFPHLSKGRIKEVHDTFKNWGIQPNKTIDTKNIRWPGVNAPIQKYTRFKSDGYVFKTTNNTSPNSKIQ